MKNFESGPFSVGQKLRYCAGTRIQTVTFVSLSPRVAKLAGKEMVTSKPQTAIVRDPGGDLITVDLVDLKPLPAN